MRTLGDRIRHTLIFEALALAIVAFGGAWIFGHSVEMMGAMSLMFSVLAMAWNLLFNYLFDLWDRKYRGMAKRGFLVRATHASLFELGMVIAGILLIAWWLDVSYWEGFVTGVWLSLFFLVYAYLYNWAYDVVFPVSREG